MDNYNNDYCCPVRERSEMCISCLTVGIIAGIISGIAAALLFFFGIVSNLTIALWVAFGVGIFTLLAAFTTAILTPVWISRRCFCRSKNALLIGGTGLVITTVIALSASIFSGSIFSAVLIGLVTFFLVLSITALVCFILCITRCS